MAAVRNATLATPGAGLRAEHGLIGSAAWWNAIASGHIPVHTVEGRVSRVVTSGLPSPDWEEFQIESGGQFSSWSRLTSGGAGGSRERAAKAALYRVGSAVLLTYVEQRIRHAIPGAPPLSKCVLEIWIDDRPLGSSARQSNKR